MNAPRDLPMGLVYDLPFERYLAIDAVSASALRVFARSPWHYRHRVEVKPTRPMLRGTLAHCALLEPDALHQRYAIVPAGAPKRPTRAQWAAKKGEWLPNEADGAFIQSLMKPCTAPGQYASWIAPPRMGINGQPGEYEYVKIA